MTETQYKKVPSSETAGEKNEIPSKYGYGIRHVQTFLFFMGLSLGYFSRGHLGVTIVAMTDVPPKEMNMNYNKTILLDSNNYLVPIDNETEYKKEHFIRETDYNNSVLIREIANGSDTYNTNITLEYESNFVNEDNKTAHQQQSIWNIYRTYDWPKSTQEMVQGAFFLGYFIMMFPTGLVVQRWGGKLPLQIALFLNGIISMAAPWLTAWGGWKVLCACRLAQGLSQAGLYPAIHNLLANWVPLSERGTLSSYVYTGVLSRLFIVLVIYKGSGFGTIVAFQLGGVLADSRWGWPSTFWVTGLMCLLGFLFVTIFGANKPADHKSVSEEEKRYIIGQFGDDKKEVIKTPWKKILTSKHAWACFSAHVGSGVTFVFFFTQFPTYMHAILHFNIKSSGLLSSLPYIFTFLSTIAFGHLSDFCTNRKILSVKNARKISNTIGGVGTAICITAVAFIQNPTLTVILFTTTLSCHSAGHTGWMVNYLDLAPNFSGALMAFGNTLCNSMIISLPPIISSIVIDVVEYINMVMMRAFPKDPYQWRIVFLLMAGLAFTANAFYIFFMSVDVQSWNDSEETHEPAEIKLEELPVEEKK